MWALNVKVFLMFLKINNFAFSSAFLFCFVLMLMKGSLIYSSLLAFLCDILSVWIPCMKLLKGFGQFCSVQFLSYAQNVRCAGCAMAQAITGLSLEWSMFDHRQIRVNIISHYSFNILQSELHGL